MMLLRPVSNKNLCMQTITLCRAVVVSRNFVKLFKIMRGFTLFFAQWRLYFCNMQLALNGPFHEIGSYLLHSPVIVSVQSVSCSK